MAAHNNASDDPPIVGRKDWRALITPWAKGRWLAGWSLGACVLLGGSPIALAQSIAPAPDGTGTTITVNGNQIDIGGGSRSSDGANLFHSFQQFNLNSNEIANFLATPELRNILGRVVGGDPSRIDGLIQVTGGNPNLFLINPAGLIFGPNARLDVPGSFTATSATGLGFGDRWLNGIGSNDYASLVGDPTGFAFAVSQPGAIFNAGNLSVPFGQNLSLVGGTVLSVGHLSAPGGRLTVTAVPGESFVRLTPEGSVLAIDLPTAGRSGVAPGARAIGPIVPRSIPELLAGQPVMANGLTVNPDGTVSISYVQGSLQPGDVAVWSVQAGIVTLSATNNLIVWASQLQATGNLNLSAGNRVIAGNTSPRPSVPTSQVPTIPPTAQDLAAILSWSLGLFPRVVESAQISPNAGITGGSSANATSPSTTAGPGLPVDPIPRVTSPAVVTVSRLGGQVLDLQALRNQAKAAIASCNNAAGLDCQRKAITEARSTGNLVTLQQALTQLGQAHYQAGEYADALKTYEEARLLAVGHNQPQWEAIAESDLGSVYGALGEFAESTEHYQRALKLARSHQLANLESRVLNNLGLIAANQRDFAQAKTYQEQALAVARQQQNPGAQALALTQLGLLHYQNTDYTAAVAAQTQALKLAEQGNDRLAMARILDHLGLAEFGRNNYQAAAAAQTRALALTRELGDRHGEARTLSNLGDTQYHLKQFDQSIANLQAAVETWERLRENLPNDGARLAIFETQETTYSTLQTVLLAAQQPERALEINERSRSQALLKLLAEDSQSNDRAQSNRSAEPANSRMEPINIDRIRQVAREQSATLISYAIEWAVMDIDGQRQPTDLGVNIWVVQPSGQVQFRQVKLPSYQFLKDQLSLLRVFLSARQVNRSGETGTGLVRSVVPGLRQLHDLLITPIADLLPTQEGDRLIVMPQQELFLVPFSALQDAQGRYLIERYSLATAPSIQILDRTFQQAQQLRDRGVKLGDRPLIVGNPTMPTLPSRRSNNQRSQLAPLPNAEAEAMAVAKMLRTQALTGRAATKVAVLDRIQQASLIHLATHGILDSERGLDSAIALAPMNDGDDGWLTARELLNLDLNAQLVVLSACNTGQGALSGDGIIGLSRSLLAAGVPSAIVTQWAVPDAPTAALMTRFYEFLGQGLDKAAALRQATLVTMQQYPDPIDWAAFTLIGDTH